MGNSLILSYDTIRKNKIRMILSSFGIPAKLTELIMLTMSETINKIKIKNQLQRVT